MAAEVVDLTTTTTESSRTDDADVEVIEVIPSSSQETTDSISINTEGRRSSSRIRDRRRREVPFHWNDDNNRNENSRTTDTTSTIHTSGNNRRRRRRRNLDIIQSRRRHQIVPENSLLFRVWSQFIAGSVGLASFNNSTNGNLNDDDDLGYEEALDLANRVGVVKPPGLSKLEMEHLMRRPHIGLEDACAICLETMRKGEPSVVLPCGHCFHDACATEWLSVKAECPTCRGKVKPQIIISP